eukprot:6073133-Amphidinium_carterae.1
MNHHLCSWSAHACAWRVSALVKESLLQLSTQCQVAGEGVQQFGNEDREQSQQKIGTRSGFTSTAGQDLHLQQVRIQHLHRPGPGQDIHLPLLPWVTGGFKRGLRL